MKTCTICKTAKPLGDFYALKTGRFGVSSRCKLCDNAQSRAYQKKNQEAVRAKALAYREARRPELAAAARADYHANRSARRAVQKAWYEDHREERRLYNAQWRAENQEGLRAYEQARAGHQYMKNVLWRHHNRAKWRAYTAEYVRLRKANLVAAQPPWADRRAIREVYMLCQMFSENTGVPHHVDHIVPLKGKNVCGLHIETNLQILTADENRKKHNSFEQD